MAELRARVRALTKRTWGVAMDHRRGRLDRYVQGWFGYHRISRTWGDAARQRGDGQAGRHGPERSAG